MWLVRAERIIAKDRVAADWVQGGKNILQFPLGCELSHSPSSRRSPRSEISWAGAMEYPPHPRLSFPAVSNPIGYLSRDLGL